MAREKAKSNASGSRHRARWGRRAEVKASARKGRRQDDRRELLTMLERVWDAYQAQAAMDTDERLDAEVPELIARAKKETP